MKLKTLKHTDKYRILKDINGLRLLNSTKGLRIEAKLFKNANKDVDDDEYILSMEKYKKFVNYLALLTNGINMNQGISYYNQEDFSKAQEMFKRILHSTGSYTIKSICYNNISLAYFYNAIHKEPKLLRLSFKYSQLAAKTDSTFIKVQDLNRYNMYRLTHKNLSVNEWISNFGITENPRIFKIQMEYDLGHYLEAGMHLAQMNQRNGSQVSPFFVNKILSSISNTEYEDAKNNYLKYCIYYDLGDYDDIKSLGYNKALNSNDTNLCLLYGKAMLKGTNFGKYDDCHRFLIYLEILECVNKYLINNNDENALKMKNDIITNKFGTVYQDGNTTSNFVFVINKNNKNFIYSLKKYFCYVNPSSSDSENPDTSDDIDGLDCSPFYKFWYITYDNSKHIEVNVYDADTNTYDGIDISYIDISVLLKFFSTNKRVLFINNIAPDSDDSYIEQIRCKYHLLAVNCNMFHYNYVRLIRILADMDSIITNSIRFDVSNKTSIKSIYPIDNFSKDKFPPYKDIIYGFQSVLKGGEDFSYNKLVSLITSLSLEIDNLNNYDLITLIPSHTGKISRIFKYLIDFVMSVLNITKPIFNTDIIKAVPRRTSAHKLSAERNGNLKRLDLGAALHRGMYLNENYKNEIRGKNICVFDDFITTGATSEAVRNLLEHKFADANHITFISIGLFLKWGNVKKLIQNSSLDIRNNGVLYQKEEYKFNTPFKINACYINSRISKDSLYGCNATNRVFDSNIRDAFVRAFIDLDKQFTTPDSDFPKNDEALKNFKKNNKGTKRSISDDEAPTVSKIISDSDELPF